MTKSKLALIIFLGGFTMGTGNLPNLASSPTKVDATTEQYNAITDALHGHQVMRETDGTPVNNTYDIGRPSSGQPRKLYLGTGLNVAGKDINLDSIALQPTGISSGAAKDSGYPQFLQAGGAGNDYFTVLASATDLEMTIDGESYTLESDTQSADLALAPASNNTCLLNEPNFSAQEVTATVGEWGSFLQIDTIGSELTSLDDTVQCFKIGSEVFIGYLDSSSSKIYPINRGIAGTTREKLSNNDTVTLLKGHYIFLDNDLATMETTANYPTWSATAPTSPSTGDRWYDATNKTWKRYSGSAWEQRGEIFLGFAICDDTDCLYVEPVDFNLNWDDLVEYESFDYDVSNLKIKGPVNVSVAGIQVFLNEDKEFSVSTGERWHYLYIDSNGEYHMETVPPRPKGLRKGLYHPNEYWRCIGVYYYYSFVSGSRLKMTSDGSVGCYGVPPTSTFRLLHNVSGSGGGSTYKLAYDDLCPIARTHTIYLTTNCTTSDLYYWLHNVNNTITTEVIKGGMSGATSIKLCNTTVTKTIESGTFMHEYSNLSGAYAIVSGFNVEL